MNLLMYHQLAEIENSNKWKQFKFNFLYYIELKNKIIEN